jgi:hypothetical protein
MLLSLHQQAFCDQVLKMVYVVSVVPEILNSVDPEPLHRKDKNIGV